MIAHFVYLNAKIMNFRRFTKKRMIRFVNLGKTTYLCTRKHANYGGLAQLARALAWHARGHRFDSDILHQA